MKVMWNAKHETHAHALVNCERNNMHTKKERPKQQKKKQKLKKIKLQHLHKLVQRFSKFQVSCFMSRAKLWKSA